MLPSFILFFFTFWNSGVLALSRTWRCGPFLYDVIAAILKVGVSGGRRGERGGGLWWI